MTGGRAGTPLAPLIPAGSRERSPSLDRRLRAWERPRGVWRRPPVAEVLPPPEGSQWHAARVWVSNAARTTGLPCAEYRVRVRGRESAEVRDPHRRRWLGEIDLVERRARFEVRGRSSAVRSRRETLEAIMRALLAGWA